MELVVSPPAPVHHPFSPPQGLPLTVLQVTASDVVPPSPIAAVGPDQTAAVDTWAARQRAEISRRSLALRGAEVAARRIEDELSADGEVADELVSVLDTMLDKSVIAAGEAVESARRRAVDIVTSEWERLAARLRAEGRDPMEVIGPNRWTAPTSPGVRAPRSAATLWTQLSADASGRPALHLVDRARPDDRTAVERHDEDDTHRHPSGGPPSASSPARDRTARPDQVAPPLSNPQPPSIPSRWPDPEVAAAEFPPPLDPWSAVRSTPGDLDDATVFDVFWGAAGNDRSVRDRLRRRPAQEQR